MTGAGFPEYIHDKSCKEDNVGNVDCVLKTE